MNNFLFFIKAYMNSSCPDISQTANIINYKLMHIPLSFYFQSFANSFTLGLQRECAPHGIKVQLLTPFFVSTNMTKYAKVKNIFIPSVDSYCRWAIFTLGKTYATCGYWSHEIQVRLKSNFISFNNNKNINKFVVFAIDFRSYEIQYHSELNHKLIFIVSVCYYENAAARSACNHYGKFGETFSQCIFCSDITKLFGRLSTLL